MNKTTGLTISQLKIIMCVGTKAQDEKKCIESQQNQPWAQVQYTIFSVTDFVPTDRKKSFKYTAKPVCGKSTKCQFLFSAMHQICHYQSH